MNIKKLHVIVLILTILFSSSLYATQQDSIVPFDKAYKRNYNIQKVTDGNKPIIDGKLDDSFWRDYCEWSDIFVQIIPYERVISPSPTRVKLAYDDKNIYVGVWCKDIKPEKINRFIGNRDDNSLGDLISVAFDTYHDFRAAVEFNINVGGNKTDLIVTDKLNVNLSWNAVWEGKTSVNVKDSSWYAELLIPFSQLRYNRETNDGVWGLHVRRIIRKNNEVQNWSMIPLKNNGHVFSFGEMHGMDDLPKPKGIEFLPYGMVKYKNQPRIKNSPYTKNNSWQLNGGIDAKMAISDYTMDITVNPDYGQVELDPSVMNLTAYETFYDEKRPFFLEGKHILDFAYNNDMMFYTRRIGAMPRYTPPYDNVYSYATEPNFIPIIGAVKLTGTNRNGLTIGVIESITAKTFSKYTQDGEEDRVMTEPLTNYTVARIQKNWKGNTLLGGVLTSVNRFGMEDHIANIAVKDAITAGIDFMQYFKNRLYYIDSKVMFSSLNGSKEAIYLIQTNPVHYFQRTSSYDYLQPNQDQTSFNGTGGYVKVGRKGNSKWTFAQTAGWSSPSLDLNDIGYLKESDNITTETELNYRQTDIWKFFRYNNFILTQGNKWNFGGVPTNNYVAFKWQSMSLSRIELNMKETFGWNMLDTRMLRSGPDMRFDPYFITSLVINSDKAKRVVFSLRYEGDHKLDGYNRYNSLMPMVNFRIGTRFYISGQVNCTWNRDNLQYITTVIPKSNSEKKLPKEYIMGHLDQKTYGLTIKAQLNITPDISFQYYGSPFTSIGQFTAFKEAAATTSHNYNERFRVIGGDNITLSDNEYTVNSGDKSYSFKNPNFSFNEFRSNLVLRWEYMRGSTAYLVWENRVSNNTTNIITGWGSNLERMFSLPATNTIMLKVNFWFGL